MYPFRINLIPFISFSITSYIPTHLHLVAPQFILCQVRRPSRRQSPPVLPEVTHHTNARHTNETITTAFCFGLYVPTPVARMCNLKQLQPLSALVCTRNLKMLLPPSVDLAFFFLIYLQPQCAVVSAFNGMDR